MTRARLPQWTEAEVHRLKIFADGKVSADTIAKSLGRSVKSVMKKASWLGLILSRKVTARQRGNDGDATTALDARTGQRASSARPECEQRRHYCEGLKHTSANQVITLGGPRRGKFSHL